MIGEITEILGWPEVWVGRLVIADFFANRALDAFYLFALWSIWRKLEYPPCKRFTGSSD